MFSELALPAIPPALPPQVVFLHVPKTGGITFREVLSSIYGASFHVCVDPSLDAVKDDLHRFACLEFHTVRQHENLVYAHTELVKQRRWDLVSGAEVFVMFREPVDHALSAYFDMVRHRKFIEPVLKVNGLAFPNSIEEFTETPLFFNNQLAFLIGEFQPASKRKFGADDLVLAKEILNRLRIHVGLLDRYEDSLHIFERATGCSIPAGSVEVRNRNCDRPSLEAISDGLKQTIRELSAPDCELYEFARKLFEEEFCQYSPPSPTHR